MMNTRRLIGVLGCAGTALLSACSASDIAAPRTLVAMPDAGVADAKAGSGNTGVTISYTVGNQVIDHYWFKADQDAAGKTTGGFLLFELRIDKSGPKPAYAAVAVGGDVVCLVVKGKGARLGGVVKYSNFAGLPVGTTMTWSVTDNGKKGASDDDTVSALYAGVDPQGYCKLGLAYPEVPVSQGSVKVTP